MLLKYIYKYTVIQSLSAEKYKPSLNPIVATTTN